MLRTPAPFPQVGSYALFELEGRHHLARIIHRTAGGEATIALPLIRDVASGNRTVPLEDLIDATPLSAAERSELARIEIENGKADRPARSKQARAEKLRDRLINAPILADLIARIPDPALRASKVAA